MASNPEFRRVVNYTDLEVLLECMFAIFYRIDDTYYLVGPLCLDRFDQPRTLSFYLIKYFSLMII